MSSAAAIANDPEHAPVRAVVAMPHARLRTAIAAALEATAAITVVAQSGDIDGAVECTRATRPDVVLLGTSLVVGDVVDGVQRITRGLDGVPVVLAGHEDTPAYVAAVLTAGAAAYVLLRGDADELARTLSCAATAGATRKRT